MDVKDTARPPGEEDRERRLLWLLQRIHTYSQTTKSDLAREYADEIAEAASRWFITTAIVPGCAYHGRLWKITATGLQFLTLKGNLIAAEEIENYKESYTQ